MTRALHELAAEVAETAKSKGFDVPTWAGSYADDRDDPVWRESNFLSKLMLVVTEIDEAIQAQTDRDALALEMADIAIRLLGILHHCFGDTWEVGEADPAVHPLPIFANAPAVFYPVLRNVVRAARAWRKDDKHSAEQWCTAALRETVHISALLGIDLIDAIVRKNALNLARPALHGGKKRLG